ncbi:hypothetical protein PPYR_02623 [Photinus pyralis]|uniref:Ig-like domain-containing protein n=2 Tax=Photinus pyralis TaxID=7054 RepID=A0A5N4B7Z8_PHOPY|nr:protein turtle-like isoform X1 [Photinus pyralis]KAB0805653.1 hypothetical protein PPYR_02623 [Photinus pyralis]
MMLVSLKTFRSTRKDLINSVAHFLLLMVGAIWFQSFHVKSEDDSVNVIHHVDAVQGGVAKLPCDITPAVKGDKMHIVIWYKEGIKSKPVPIYTFDSRDKQLKQGKHWSDEHILGGRAYFRYQDEPAKLTLDSVKESDGGIYQCRVDFRQTPTRNIKVNLTVIIPPEKLSILDERGVHIPHYILGPYNEGASVNITCVATGGRPLPEVTWWQENALLDESFEPLTARRVRNILHLEQLERRDLHRVFTCQATNNELVTPISSSVTLDMNLRPLWVKLLGENRPLSAENTYELNCEVVGSRPPPTITWWKGSIQMTNTRETTSPDSNTTTSVLTFSPTIDDGGKFLSCRGQQQLIPKSGIEDGWKLDIHHVPLVSLELGSNLNGSTIKEGVDVYFECNIKSNPWVYKVSWRHNAKVLYNNAGVGTIVSNQSLVLQNVTRSRSGLYTCVGSNQEGDGESNVVQLDVKFAPVCRPGQPKIYGVARQEIAEIRCELESNPTDIQFTWKFNNTDNNLLTVDLPQNLIATDRARSTASYQPMTERDYGTLLCSGSNEIGDQREPCVFYINPAGKPDSLSNCTIQNQTVESLHVECIEGFDGGLHQEFIMELYDTLTRKLVNNVTSKIPTFTVSGLESGLEFQIGLYAINKKGKSSTSYLQTHTLKSAEKHTALTPVLLHITPILGILIGVVSSLILVAIIIILVIRVRGASSSDDYKDSRFSCRDGENNSKNSMQTLSKELNSSTDSLEEKNPDIVPHNSGDSEYQEEERAFERLNNSSVRNYNRLQTLEDDHQQRVYDSYNSNEITYAELSLGKQQLSPVIYSNQQSIPMSVIRTQEPTLYAQIDVSKCVQPTYLNSNSVSFSCQSSAVPHQHYSEYMPRPNGEEHLQDGYTTAETPLISNRENNVIQPLREGSCNRSPMSATQPRSTTATATRF